MQIKVLHVESGNRYFARLLEHESVSGEKISMTSDYRRMRLTQMRLTANVKKLTPVKSTMPSCTNHR